MSRETRFEPWTGAGYPAPSWMTDPQPPYLTISEVLAALRISRATYYRMVKAGTLHPRHVSPGRVLVPRADVDRILKGETKCQSAPEKQPVNV